MPSSVALVCSSRSLRLTVVIMSRYPSQAQSSATNRGQVGQRGAPTTKHWPPALTLKVSQTLSVSFLICIVDVCHLELGDVVGLVYGLDDEFTAGQIVYITDWFDTLSSTVSQSRVFHFVI